MTVGISDVFVVPAVGLSKQIELEMRPVEVKVSLGDCIIIVGGEGKKDERHP